MLTKKTLRNGETRRDFLRHSALVAGGGAALAAAPGLGGAAHAQEDQATASTEITPQKTVCHGCAVGCSLIAELRGGQWIGVEPAFDSPINAGSLCPRGLAAKGMVSEDRRLRTPMKLVDGAWVALGWDEAINQIGDKLNEIREKGGPDAVGWLASAGLTNEQGYLLRKAAAFWGTNNIDHQGRLFDAASEAGLASLFGDGAMTNPLNDLHNSRAVLVLGGDPAATHPVAMLHLLKAKEENNAPLIVADNRFTTTGAHADEFVSLRPGTDIAFAWGLLWHVLQNGWEDSAFIRQRLFGMEDIRTEVGRWSPDEVRKVTGIGPTQMERVARLLATNRPSALLWGGSGTQASTGTHGVRALAILGLALGSVGVPGGGLGGLREGANSQGMSDMGVAPDTLPGGYGLGEEAWRYWAAAWNVSLEDLKARFSAPEMMTAAGIPGGRWIDGVLENKDNMDQRDNLRAMLFFDYETNLLPRQEDVGRALERLELIVATGSYPPLAGVLGKRSDGVFLLPQASVYEGRGSATSMGRHTQWREPVVKPLYESKPLEEILYRLARKLGFSAQMFKTIHVENTEPKVEDITTEIANTLARLGYGGLSPERLIAQRDNQQAFDRTSLQAVGGPVDGEFYGLPRPCWGRPEDKHPGTPVLYDSSRPVREGGHAFPAVFGETHEGDSLLADGSWPTGAVLQRGHGGVSMAMLQGLGWQGELRQTERTRIDGSNGQATHWDTDLSGGLQRVALLKGLSPAGNGRARCVAWDFSDPVPVHREPLFTARRDLVAAYPTYEDGKAFRLPTAYRSLQDRDVLRQYPLLLSTGFMAEHMGGGGSSRANPWLAGIAPEMVAEIHPFDANSAGVRPGAPVWVVGPSGGRIRVTARVTQRVPRGQVWLPLSFAGQVAESDGASTGGVADIGSRYPKGTQPLALGAPALAVAPAGYDIVTQMPETRACLCRIEAA